MGIFVSVALCFWVGLGVCRMSQGLGLTGGAWCGMGGGWLGCVLGVSNVTRKGVAFVVGVL